MSKCPVCGKRHAYVKIYFGQYAKTNTGIL